MRGLIWLGLGIGLLAGATLRAGWLLPPSRKGREGARLISSPGEIANYLSRIPRGETRTMDRLRNELARKAGANAMCPVTTAIYLRIVAEVALDDLAQGKRLEEVVPFWRVVLPGSKVAAKLSCGPDHVAHLIALDGGEEGAPFAG